MILFNGPIEVFDYIKTIYDFMLLIVIIENMIKKKIKIFIVNLLVFVNVFWVGNSIYSAIIAKIDGSS